MPRRNVIVRPTLPAMRQAFYVLIAWAWLGAGAFAQGVPETPATDVPTAPAQVEVRRNVGDEEIRSRLRQIMETTGWYAGVEITVTNGVVVLHGRAESAELRKWAGDLARNTEGVVAVANRMQIAEPDIWNFATARQGLGELRHDVLRSLPFLLVGLLILAVALGASWLTLRAGRSVLRDRIRSRLIRGVFAWGLAVVVFVAGLYVVLRVSGLTQLALTVVGGTGLVGLALGIAFRDITENFLASIFLSVRPPFEMGDLVEIGADTGYVQQLNVRATVLMTLDGTIVQIPNATVYKGTVRNFTTNSNRREHFVVGIGYDAPIDRAQEIAREVLDCHPAVLSDPEPMVLVDNLGKATIDLKIHFWLDGRRHSWVKVRSSVIRLVKRAFQEQGISMPDEAREIVFPERVPVVMVDPVTEQPPREPPGRRPALVDEADPASTKAEAGLASEADMLSGQARGARVLGKSENLLAGGRNRAPGS
ncbi:MAG: mechanosensitive ion channel domain-containing protein [Pseudomonadota bacterium]